ncbi:MAG: TM2 domain-containing protein [Acetobacteraceae bacterium]
MASRDIPEKSRVAAGLLAIFVGGLGVHKFYLGEVGLGVLYLLFSWTLIPALVGLIEGIYYLCMSDARFARRFH